MSRKTDQLQIRVTPEQKERLRKLARTASMDVSSWVLNRVLPAESEQFQSLVAVLASASDTRYALAEIADYLKSLPAGAFQRAVDIAPEIMLDPSTLNYLAGAIELACRRRAVPPPAWTAAVPIPESPMFGSALESVRLHLLLESPAALRRRNLFVDASLDDRV